MSASHEIDQDKLEEFMGRFVGDLGAAMSAALVVIGDRLGLYAAIADGQPITAEELASRTRATRAFSVQNRPRGVREASTGAILHHRGAFPAKRSGRQGCLASLHLGALQLGQPPAGQDHRERARSRHRRQALRVQPSAEHLRGRH